MAGRLIPALLGLLLSILTPHALQAAVTWRDDAGTAWQVPAKLPARWVVLGPHLVEMIELLGRADRIVGVLDDHAVAGAHGRSRSGYPVVGTAGRVNVERLREVRPDLVVAWPSGLSPSELARLRRQGIPVLAMEPARLEDLPDRLRWLGWLSGRDKQAEALSRRWTGDLETLRQRHAAGPRRKAFYQVWLKPLFTLSPRHLVSQAISLCGFDVVAPDTALAAPVMGLEAVLKAQPDVILFGPDQASASRLFWLRFSRLPAVRKGGLVVVNDAALTRPGPSLLTELPHLCDQLLPWRTLP